MRKRGRFSFGICFLMCLLVLIGNIIIYQKYFWTSLVLLEKKERIENPIGCILHPGESYVYELEVLTLTKCNANLSLMIENIDPKTAEIVYLEIIYSDYTSKSLSLNSFQNEWVHFPINLDNSNDKLLLKFFIPIEVGNDAQNLQLSFITNLRVEK